MEKHRDDVARPAGRSRRHRGGRRRTWVLAGVGAVLAVVAAACVPPTLPEVPPSPIPFTEIVVDDALAGAAFTVEADVWGDDRLELVVSSFGKPAGGPGQVGIYTMGADLTDWTRTDVVTPADGIAFPNDVTVHDVDGDGDMDVIVPGGFFICEFTFSPCGSLQWFEQDGGSWIRHQIVPPGNARFFHVARMTDLDGDGIDDLVTVSETSSSARTEWYRGTATGTRFESTPRIIGPGGGSLAVVEDVDGDGDMDVVSPQFFGGTGFVWFEQVEAPSPGAPAGVWTRHVATTATRQGFSIERVHDLLGDGVDRWVATNHVGDDRAGVFVLDQPADPRDPWTSTKVSEGIRNIKPTPGSLAPGLAGVGDIDGDGRLDVAVSGDGDPRLFWLRQEVDGSFSTFVVAEDRGQSGGARVLDLDDDGTAELVFSSYEQDRLSLFVQSP